MTPREFVLSIYPNAGPSKHPNGDGVSAYFINWERADGVFVNLSQAATEEGAWEVAAVVLRALPYEAIPVEAARSVAERFRKSVVIVTAFDPVFGQMHTTTYGSGSMEREWAAEGGEIIVKALGAQPDMATFFENYRAHCCLRSGHLRTHVNDAHISSAAPGGVPEITVSCVAHPKAEPGGAPEWPLTASETLYSFVGWLTTRAQVLTLGAEHDAAPAADVIAEFCAASGIENPRDGWEKFLALTPVVPR